MKIAVIGTGYVGLVSGICLAHNGHNVTCVDKNPKIIENLNNNQLTIHEKGLEELYKSNREKNLISFTTDLSSAMDKAEVVLICVGTPFDGKQIDLKYIKSATEDIADVLDKSSDGTFKTIVLKSTAVPGTTKTYIGEILKNKVKDISKYCIAMNPEFLREGVAVDDFLNPDRIVIGCDDNAGISSLQEMYKSFACEKVVTSPTTAEMIKYSANSLLATLISYSNEISNICETLEDVDVTEVERGVHLDKRFTNYKFGKPIKLGALSYLKSGCGFGGSCFPKDVKALNSFAIQKGISSPILSSVIQVNDARISQIQKLIKPYINTKQSSIGILGLSFKPDTDDIRESISIKLIDAVKEQGVKIFAHDPIVNSQELTKQGRDDLNDSVNILPSIEDVIKKTDIILILTAWDEYKNLNFNHLKEINPDCVVFDGRRVLDKKLFPKNKYIALGLGNSSL